MKFTAFLFLTIATTAIATSPLPSNTRIRINTEHDFVISKSRVSTKLGRSPVLPAVKAATNSAKIARAADAVASSDEHAALHYLSNAIRNASTGAVREKRGMRGMSRRSESGAAKTAGRQKLGQVLERAADEKVERSSGMGIGKARRAVTRAERQQARRDSKFLSARW